MMTLLCSLPFYFMMKKKHKFFVFLFALLFFLIMAPLYIVPLVLFLFLEFFRILFWLGSCCFCFKRKHCRFKSLKTNKYKDTKPKDYSPPYKKELLLSDSNIGKQLKIKNKNKNKNKKK